MSPRLPPFTFLNGPVGSGKSTLASLIAHHDTGAIVCSFATPIRNALIATFYADNVLDPPNLKDPKVKAAPLPFTTMSHRDWMVKYSDFMKLHFGVRIFGDLAKREVATLDHYYNRFVFDDNRYLAEIDPFSLAFGRQNCLMIHLERTGTSWTTEQFDRAGKGDFLTYVGTQHLALTNNGTPEDTYQRLLQLLPQPEPESTP